DIDAQGYNYLVTRWLPKLQADQVDSLSGKQDVGRMGISHACIIDTKSEPVPYYPKGLPKPGAGSEAEERRVRLGAGNRPPVRGGGGFGRGGFGAPGGGFGGTMPGGRVPVNSDDMKMIERTQFVVQFHWTPIPKTERVGETAEGDGEGAGDAEAADEENL